MNRFGALVTARCALIAVTQLLVLMSFWVSNASAVGGPAPTPGNPRLSDIGVTGDIRKPLASFVFQWDPVPGAPAYQVIVPGCQSLVAVSRAALPPATGGMSSVSAPPYAVRASGCRCSLVDPRVVTVPVKPAYTKFSAPARPDRAQLKFPKPCPQ